MNDKDVVRHLIIEVSNTVFTPKDLNEIVCKKDEIEFGFKGTAFYINKCIFMCDLKKWAAKYNYVIKSSFEYDKGFAWLSYTDSEEDEELEPNDFYSAETEADAVIKACIWIFKQIKGE